jgi:tetratricopeptide (TPR) repeat protein
MPFEMRTAPELSYLSDGLAVLLSTRLDAGGPLHAINARSVLTVLERDKSISPEQLAARFDASLYVNGSVVQAGDTVEIDATLMDARGHGSLGHAHAVGPAQALFSLVDGLTRDLLAQYLRGNREQLASTAALTSGSLPALKAFLEGEELLRVARYGAAEDAFDRAIANDSMFALAYYRRSVARVWNGDIAAATSDAGRATQLSSRLGDRDKEIVGALFAARKGEAAEAERRYRTIVQRYPDEMEAWFEMADVIFHVAPARGGSISDARAAFQRVLAFEPDHQPAMVHLARIATVEGRTAALDTLTAKVLRLGPRGDHAAEMRLMRAVVLHDTAAEQALIRDVEEEGSSRLLDAAWRVSGYTREFGSMLRVMTRLSPYMHDEWRSGVLLLRSHLAARIGNDAVAAACLDSLRQSAPVAALATRAVFATSGLTPIDRAAVVLLRAEIAAANFGQRRATPDIYVGHSSPDTLEPAFKHFYLGMLSLKLDDARAAQAQLDSLVAVTETPQAENAVALLNASLLNRAGHRKAAISTLDTALDASGLRIITTTPFLPRPMIRYTLAQLLTADGKPDEAARIRGSLPEDFSFGVLFLAR